MNHVGAALLRDFQHGFAPVLLPVVDGVLRPAAASVSSFSSEPAVAITRPPSCLAPPQRPPARFRRRRAMHQHEFRRGRSCARHFNYTVCRSVDGGELGAILEADGIGKIGHLLRRDDFLRTLAASCTRQRWPQSPGLSARRRPRPR